MTKNELTIKVYSEKEMKRKKSHELRLERVRFRARNKCLSAILDKIENGYNLEELRQYCYGQESINLEKIDKVKEVLINVNKYKSWENLKKEYENFNK